MADKHTISIDPDAPRAARAAYLEWLEASGRAANTLVVYGHHTRMFADYLDSHGIASIEDTTLADLEAFVRSLRGEHNPGGVHGYFRSIRAWFRWYWDRYEPDEPNPISRVKVKQPAGQAKPGIPITHYNRMVDACDTVMGLRDRAILFALLDTCARATEFVSIDIGDVDFSTGHILLKNTKGRKRRSVRIGDKGMRALRAYLRTRGKRLPADEPLFTTDEGGRHTRFSLRLMLDRRADAAKVPHYGLHDIRRRGAYLLHKNGMPIKEISKYLGHTTVTVTERYLAIEDDDIMTSHRRASPVDNAGL